MLPFAYGRANFSGSKLFGTANFIYVDRNSSRQYKVFVKGLTNSLVIVLSFMGVYALPLLLVNASSGYFVLSTSDVSPGQYGDGKFNFVVYN